MVRLLLVEVYEREGKSVILFCKKAREGEQIHFMAVKKSRKHSGFVIYDSAFTAVEKDEKF